MNFYAKIINRFAKTNNIVTPGLPFQTFFQTYQIIKDLRMYTKIVGLLRSIKGGVTDPIYTYVSLQVDIFIHTLLCKFTYIRTCS